MPTDDKKKRALKTLRGVPAAEVEYLGRVYEQARRDRDEGMSYSAVNAEIRASTGGRVGGLSHLEKLLDTGEVKKAREEKYRAEDVAAKGRGERALESVQNIGDAMTFGWGGEAAGLAAGLGAAMVPGGQGFGEAYRETQAGADQLVQGARETSPVAAGLGRAAGMGATSLAAAHMLPSTAASRAAQPLRAKIGGGLARGTAGGFGGGFMEGASDPNAEGGRLAGGLRGGLWGSAIGGPLGAVAPLVAAGAGKLAAAAGAGGSAAQRRARGIFSDLLEDAGISTQEFAERGARAPRGTVPGELTGGLRRRTRAVRNLAPDLEDTPQMRALERRQAATGERMAGELREAAGLEAGYQPRRVFQRSREVWKAEQLDPLMARSPRVSGDGLGDLVENNRELRRALRKGGVDIDDLNSEHDFQKLWAAREELLHRANSPDLNGFERDQTYKAIEDLSELLNERVPGFSQMIGKYKQIKAVESAFEIGESFAGKSARELEDAMDMLDLDDPEVSHAFKQGLMAWFEKGLEDTTGQGGAVAAKLRALTPRMRARLNAMFGSTDDVVEYAERYLAEKEVMWARMHSAISGNSTTAQQATDMLGIMDDPTRAPMIRDFLNKTWLFLRTNPSTRKETLMELGQLLIDADVLDNPAQLQLLVDSIEDIRGTVALTRTGVGPVGVGAQASEFEPDPREAPGIVGRALQNNQSARGPAGPSLFGNIN